MMRHPAPPIALAQREAAYTLHRYDLAADKPAFLAQKGTLCRAAATNGNVPLTAPMFAAMPNLELVACSSAGYESIDLAALTNRGIRLTNASSALKDDVADTAIMLMLAARRALIAGHDYVKSGDWARHDAFPLQHTTHGKRLGIVGMGTIGQAIAARAEALAMQISYWNRSAKDLPWHCQPDLIRLARESDTLIVIVAGGEGTRGLISADVLAALGPDGLLVNVARGSVVDEPALIAALSSGALGRAALDVFASEPNADPRLTSLPNVTLYPHHASGTVETRDAMAQLVVDNLAAFYAGAPLASEVNLRR
jgi:lactate dehydrogenase-like 2-hydroxyacid dehydrogenase